MFFPDNEGGTARMIALRTGVFWIPVWRACFFLQKTGVFKAPIIRKGCQKDSLIPRKIQEENMSKELAKTYDPKGIEDGLYKKWMDNGYFHAAQCNRTAAYGPCTG